MAKITIYVPDQDPLKFDLEGQSQVSVGRSPDMDIILEHPSISSSHAVFKLVGEEYHLQDLGSTNGTFVEGEAITEVQLVNGSKITLGTVEADFEAPELAPAAAAEAHAGEDSATAEDFGDSEAGYVASEVTVAESSVRPAGFTDLSPIEKVEKKDSLGMAAMVIGTVAIVAAIALVVLSSMMTAN